MSARAEAVIEVGLLIGMWATTAALWCACLEYLAFHC